MHPPLEHAFLTFIIALSKDSFDLLFNSAVVLKIKIEILHVEMVIC